jgi:hypothetical protein
MAHLEDNPMALRLDQAARSLFLSEFVAAFALTLRYMFKPKIVPLGLVCESPE